MPNLAESKNTSQIFSVDEVMKKNPVAYVLLTLIVRRSGKSTKEEHLEVPEVEVRDYLEWGMTRGKFRAALSFLEKHGLIQIMKKTAKAIPNAKTTQSPGIKLSSIEAYNKLSYVEKIVCNPMYDHATHLSFLSSSSPPSSFSLPPSPPVTSSSPISISLSPSLPPNYPLFCDSGKPSESQKKNFLKDPRPVPKKIRFSYEHYTFAGLDEDGIKQFEAIFPTKDVRFELWRMIAWFTLKNDRKRGGGIDFVSKWLTKAVPVQRDGSVSYCKPSETCIGFQDQVDYNQYVDERMAFAAARKYHTKEPQTTWQQDLIEASKRRDEREAQQVRELCLI